MISAFDFARLVFGSARGALVILAVYADDSRDNNLFTVGGFMGFPETFVEAERHWRMALKNAGIDYFKAYECEHLTGQFDPTRLLMEPKACRTLAERVRGDLRKILIDNHLGGIGLSIDLKAFREVLVEHPDSKNFFMGEDPYIYAFIAFIKQCVYLMNTDGGEVLNEIPIAFVLDEHSKWKEADEAYRALKQNPSYASRLGAISHADDKISVPLQMADLMAYEARLRSHSLMRGDEPRPEFIRLANNSVIFYIGVQEKSVMLQLLEQARDNDGKTKSRHGDEKDSVCIEDGTATQDRSGEAV